MKIALIQANYFPWIGYYSIMHEVDIFLVYEDVQYTKNDYRNRNWLNSPQKNEMLNKIWLTVPVKQETMKQKYRDIKISNNNWPEKQIKTLHHLLGKNQNWKNICSEINILFSEFKKMKYLHEVNRASLEFVHDLLKIKTPIKYIEKYPQSDSPSIRVANIIKDHGGQTYLSGPNAKNYIREEDFNSYGIKVEWCDYYKIIANFVISKEYAYEALKNPQSILFDLSNKILERK